MILTSEIKKLLKELGWNLKPTGYGGYWATHPNVANVDIKVVVEAHNQKEVYQVSVSLESDHVLSIYPRMGMTAIKAIIQAVFNLNQKE